MLEHIPATVPQLMNVSDEVVPDERKTLAKKNDKNTKSRVFQRTYDGI